MMSPRDPIRRPLFSALFWLEVVGLVAATGVVYVCHIALGW